MIALRRRRLPPQVAHAARVALAASLLVGIVYAACVAVLDAVVSGRLIAAVDARLADRLSDVAESGLHGPADNDDIDEAPVYLWRVTASGTTALPGRAPALPRPLRLTDGQPVTARLGQVSYRLVAGRMPGGKLVAGQSLQGEEHLMGLLRDGEALAAPVLLLAMFAGALTIGLRALGPVEQSRKRQLEFTADASHELRTPLSVIRAETSLALSAPRAAQEYRQALDRIQGENARLQKIVEDLLWLARFDSAPPQPGHEPLDLATIAAGCADRFEALAATESLRIELGISGPGPSWISAPPEWIDRLAGVLVDNACRFAGPGGTVRISVAPHGARVSLVVEDSGPGVPPEDRERLFDRFHRSTDRGGSAGLGLAIADSIVRSTGGQWRVGDSALGGALFMVSWRRVNIRQHGSGQPADLPARSAAEDPARSAAENPADPPARSATENPAAKPARSATGNPADPPARSAGDAPADRATADDLAERREPTRG